MRRTLTVVLGVMTVALLLMLRLRNPSAESHVEGVAYAMQCRGCAARSSLTTAEMNRMIARGEAASPPEEVRRFKCGGCGKLELVFDNTGYERMRDAPMDRP